MKSFTGMTRYAELALLHPYHNLWVQVVQRDDPPKIGDCSGCHTRRTLGDNLHLIYYPGTGMK